MDSSAPDQRPPSIWKGLALLVVAVLVGFGLVFLAYFAFLFIAMNGYGSNK